MDRPPRRAAVFVNENALMRLRVAGAGTEPLALRTVFRFALAVAVAARVILIDRVCGVICTVERDERACGLWVF